jgi:hypothetical protein
MINPVIQYDIMANHMSEYESIFLYVDILPIKKFESFKSLSLQKILKAIIFLYEY